MRLATIYLPMEIETFNAIIEAINDGVTERLIAVPDDTDPGQLHVETAPD